MGLNSHDNENEKEEYEFNMKQQRDTMANRDKQIENLKSDLTGLEDKLKKERDLLRSSGKDRLAEKTKLIECVAKIQSLEEKLKDSQQKQCQLNDRVRVLSSAHNGRLERELHEAFDKLAKARACNITEAQLSEMEIFLEKESKPNKKCAEQMEILRKRRTEKDNDVLKTNVGGRGVTVTPRSLENAEDDEDAEEEDEDDEGYDSGKESNEYGSEEDIFGKLRVATRTRVKRMHRQNKRRRALHRNAIDVASIPGKRESTEESMETD
ncbi:golgin subfamily A member 6-like protein 4 [Anopheles ziemanni]|uniref:golgin subfamily A member 6-like protein 4 n=1 Tax=Anopheles coustani TaxID=139045 RepID=UPI002657C2E8|nr:golgin subfamily A member 6-like protein 4 [Anopheles coustani]XP_058170462.1 golgin subfamily A member 6-like protein 4 [Anopheles ziemanni]